MLDLLVKPYIANLIACLSLLVIILSAIFLYQQIRITNIWNKKRTSYDIIMESNIGKIQELRVKLETKIDIYNENETIDNVKSKLDINDHLMLDTILNYFDNLCIAVKNKAIDEIIVSDSLAGIMIAYRRWADPYIKEWREKSPRLWVDIDSYIDKWSKRIKELEKKDKKTEIASKCK